jgi:hypothetical protein
MNKFEQLIEHVINDDEAKARELFHEIVVEKSRSIYEEMMKDEELEEAADETLDEESTHDEDEKAEKAGRKVTKDIEYDDKEDKKMHEGMHDMEEALGGDQADDLIDDVEAEETGMSMEGEGDDEDDHHSDMGGNEDLEDRVVDLEDKLDELLADFERLASGEDADAETVDVDMDVDDADGMTDVEVADDEFETEGMKMPMEEAVSLKTVAKPSNSEESGVNKKAVVAANSGAKGAVAKPVHPTGTEAHGRSAPAAKELIGKVQNSVGQASVKLSAAPKAKAGAEGSINDKSVIQ